MTYKEIIEGNILIAEFDGWVLDPNSTPYKPRYTHPEKSTKITDNVVLRSSPDNFKYRESYDWLYPVLEKISEIEYVADIEITPNVTNIYADKTFCHFGDFLTAPWECAVDFIKWHNTLNQK
jgi:hypothetical protein